MQVPLHILRRKNDNLFHALCIFNYYALHIFLKDTQVVEILAVSSAAVLNEANKEMVEVARRRNPSVLRQPFRV